MMSTMIPTFIRFRQRSFMVCLSLMVFAVGLLAPLTALAAGDDVSEIDARLEGYVPTVILKDASGNGLTIFLLIVLLGMTLGVMLINAKRSHLD